MPSARIDTARSPDPRRRAREVAVVVLYRGATLLDVALAQHLLAGLGALQLLTVAHATGPLRTSSGLTVLPDGPLDRAPKRPAVLYVPGGGAGMLAALEDGALLAFIADRGAAAAWVASVCTGSLLLAAAGLLGGRRATSHPLTRPLLTTAGALPVDERLVEHGNRITGAGSLAAIDVGLALAERLRGPEGAQRLRDALALPAWPLDGHWRTRPEASDLRAGADTGSAHFLIRARAAMQRACPSGEQR